RDAVDLEQDAPGLDPGDPNLRRALAFAHPHFDRLLRDRHVRVDTNPDPAGTLHEAGQRAARRLDLARGDALGLERLEAVFAERQRLPGGRDAVDTALEGLAEFGANGLQHDRTRLGGGRFAARTALVALGELFVLRHRIVVENLALEDPDLDAAGAVSGERSGDAVIDVGAQRVQRHAAFAVPLHARDFRAAEAARAVNADTFGAEPHRRLYGALHGAAERDAALELLRDRLSDQWRVELGLTNFDDVDDNIAVSHLGDGLAQLLDVRAFLSDHHAG